MACKLFDQALFALAEEGRITEDDALRNSDSINELRLKFKLHGKGAKTAKSEDRLSGLSLHEDEPKEEALTAEEITKTAK